MPNFSTLWHDVNANPSALSSIVSAIIAAAIAIMVFTLTQYLTAKRSRTQFLLPKLEELYLLVNDVAKNNARVYKLLKFSLEGDPVALKEVETTDEIELYGHEKAKQIIMYIRLYFPHLATVHQQLFAAQRDLNNLLYLISTSTPPNINDVVNASGQVSNYLRLMEQEIIDNRDILLKERILRGKYRSALD